MGHSTFDKPSFIGHMTAERFNDSYILDDGRRALHGAGPRFVRDKASDRQRGGGGRREANAQGRVKPPDWENHWHRAFECELSIGT